MNVALEIFGDRWSLLIVRDLLFKRRRTYQEFLEAGEGIATNVLASRLVLLESEGLISKSNDLRDGRRVIYRLTRKGADLAPVLVEMILWSARYHSTAASPAELRKMTAHKSRFIASAQDAALALEDVTRLSEPSHR